jgi:hypothetical protein
MKRQLTLAAAALAAVVLSSCATKEEPVATNTLVASKVAAAPKLADLAADPVWAKARPISVDLSGGANFGGKGSTTATIKAVYSGDRIYMLVQYADPTDSVRRGPFQKQADGSWVALKSADNKGGDENTYYEDKWAFIWPMNNSIKGFDQQGCMVACHLGEGKPYGNKYTAAAGEIGDMWHMKGGRSARVGKVDDQYLNHVQFEGGKNPNAGRQSDPGVTGGDYAGIKLVSGKPEFMNKDGKAGNAGGAFYIVNGNQVPFDDSKFKAGDEVASYIVNQLVGDRGDIDVVTQWKNGVLTSVLSRKLVTGSPYDVQFSKLDAAYPFGFAAFDNAQVRHAVHFGALYLKFEQ